jgi:hypothetical protein
MVTTDHGRSQGRVRWLILRDLNSGTEQTKQYAPARGWSGVSRCVATVALVLVKGRRR